MQTGLNVAFTCRQFYIVDSYINVSATKGTYCCGLMEIMVTRTRHNIPLYLYCLFYLALQMLLGALYGPLLTHIPSVSMLRTVVNASVDPNYRLKTPSSRTAVGI